ncbi:MarR family winged helix-turn-helix transcriptional regulator [Sneathiella chinensis]|uniref:MarR family transcriptional regulator n=1 Tax=Sneathiella chinensis TaxID=349750 RepID=A0ABQ5U1K6_9PROT|nr:MarR family winged helix-turn-helix transcriptional regulator [Sneathiella chinensis]GLQ06034.1 MarR family transcriptional regulator [Sneathiella chinensis]
MQQGTAPNTPSEAYRVETQIGHLLRKAHQRASSIFQSHFSDFQITPTQFAALAKLQDEGELSQNHLGRLTAMDPATIQGVTRRLIDRGLVATRADESDRRRMLLRLTEQGQELVRELVPKAVSVSSMTLAPLSEEEERQLLDLLSKLG